MTTTNIPEWLEIDAERVADALQEAGEKLESANGELVLDFASVRRIGPDAIRAMEELARCADDKTVKIVLSSVNVNVYKVLKLARLAPRFSFAA
jgi:anti-anti-sigma regulatory factor